MSADDGYQGTNLVSQSGLTIKLPLILEPDFVLSGDDPVDQSFFECEAFIKFSSLQDDEDRFEFGVLALRSSDSIHHGVSDDTDGGYPAKCNDVSHCYAVSMFDLHIVIVDKFSEYSG